MNSCMLPPGGVDEEIGALQEGVGGRASSRVGSSRGSRHEWVIGHPRPSYGLPKGGHGGLGLPVDWVSTRAVGLLGVVGPRLGVRARGLAREGLLECPTETGREAVRGGVPKASRHTHRACAKRGISLEGVGGHIRGGGNKWIIGRDGSKALLHMHAG